MTPIGRSTGQLDAVSPAPAATRPSIPPVALPAALRNTPITTETRVSLIPLTCARCRQVIEPGAKHLRHTDHRAARPLRFVECGSCARRGGRGAALI